MKMLVQLILIQLIGHKFVVTLPVPATTTTISARTITTTTATGVTITAETATILPKFDETNIFSQHYKNIHLGKKLKLQATTATRTTSTTTPATLEELKINPQNRKIIGRKLLVFIAPPEKQKKLCIRVSKEKRECRVILSRKGEKKMNAAMKQLSKEASSF